MKTFSGRFLAVVAVISLIGNVLLYMRYSSTRPLVTVGKEVITKKQYQDQLERQAGQQVLNKMVFAKLVTQAATRDGVMPTQLDVDAQIQNIERRSPQLLAAYIQDPAKMAEVRQDLLTNLALDNLRIKDVALTPAQVAAFYARNSTTFALPQQIQAVTVVTHNEVDATTAADLLRQNTPVDVLARQPRINVVGVNGYDPAALETLLPATKQQVNVFANVAKVGDVKTIRQGPLFLSLRVMKSSRAMVPPLAQIRSQVERLARLERAPTQPVEIARLYQAAKPKFSSDKYAAYFDALQDQAGQDAGRKTASDR